MTRGTTKNKIPRIVITLLVTLVIAYLAACAYLWVQQRSFIFLPTKEITQTPAKFGIRYDEVWIDAGKYKLNGWWLPAKSPSAPVLLYLHGNDGNIGDNVEHAARFYKLGFSIFLIDYRGYGKSTDEFPSEKAVYEDAQAAWEYLTDTLRIAAERIVIYGHSLGSGIAIDLASKTPQAAALIVESGFTTLIDVIHFQDQYPYFPTDTLLTQRFDSISKLKSLRMPVLYIHGTADTVIPYTMSEVLYAKTRTPKLLTLIKGGGHDDSAAVNPQQFEQAVRDFLKLAKIR